MKARRVIDLVRGLPADEALSILRFTPQSASEPVYKVLESAVANARYAAGLRNERVEVEDLVVSAAYVDEGPTHEAVPAARAGSCLPHPQAHQPHHHRGRDVVG